MRVCFLSNGFGEDRAAALLAARLASDHPGIEVTGAPLLSDGVEYLRRGVPVAVTGWMPWSGGFSTLFASAFVRDLPNLGRILRFKRELAAHRREIDSAVVVGDVFLLMLAQWALGVPMVFVALAKSNHHTPHSAVERAILRRVAAVVITRDDETRAALEASRIRARYMGNLLMDGLAAPVSSPESTPSVVLLPGSRREAPDNLARMLDVTERVEVPARWSCALAPTVSTKAVAERAKGAGWNLDGHRLVRGRHSVDLIENGFEGAVANAAVVLGMAGAANEQAAGLGRVVVSFPGTGPQAHPKRLRQQERLLGGGAIFESRGLDAVAATVARLLRDPAERAARGLAGRTRMGRPGAAAIAAFVADELRVRSGVAS